MVDVKLRKEPDETDFTETKLLLMVVHGDTEMSNTEAMRRMMAATRSLYSEEYDRIQEIRTFTTGPDAREEPDE